MLLSDYRKNIAFGGKTQGQNYKYNSDMIMENTWDRDIQSRIGYFYSYEMDDVWWKSEGYDPTLSLTKVPLDVKLIKTTTQSLDKDQTTFMLQLRPSQKLKFEPEDELYYYEEKFRQRYNANFPIGMYVDLADEKGEYHKWIICAKTIDNQFVKYLILPCNYLFTWVSVENDKRVIRRMWGAMRSQNSYNSGLTK